MPTSYLPFLDSVAPMDFDSIPICEPVPMSSQRYYTLDSYDSDTYFEDDWPEENIPWSTVHPTRKPGSWLIPREPPKPIPLPPPILPQRNAANGSIVSGAVVAGINQLPLEVLRMIFLWYTHSRDGAATIQRMADIDSASAACHNTTLRRRVSVFEGALTNPQYLANVCKHWRTLAYSTPELWSTMCISRPCLADVAIMGDWLDRAGPASGTKRAASANKLDLTIAQREPRVGGCGGDTAIGGVLRYVLDNAHRCTQLSLRLYPSAEGLLPGVTDRDTEIAESEEGGTVAVRPYGANALPALKSFKLEVEGWSAQGASALLAWLQSAPQLLQSGDPPLQTLLSHLDIDEASCSPRATSRVPLPFVGW